MNIREISTARLREYENNPRNNDLAVEKVKYSIERFGFLFPVVVDVNFVIVCGHTRVRACRELGITSVPCIVADELTEEQINFFRLVDNKTSEYSDWDFEKLKEELSLVDLTLEENQLLLEQFELTAEVFDIDVEQAEIRIPSFNFMGVNDKPKAPPVKRPVAVDGDDDDDGVDYESYTDEQPTSGFTAEATPQGVNIEATNDAEESMPNETVGEPKKSKAILQFCKFRFGDFAFFISQVELDSLNAKYAEFIDSGAILEGSFANYLLKGVETDD
jgi:hypothetical protein